MKVVNLDDYRKKEHIHGHAKCLNCGHEWHAVADVGTRWLECPSCSSMKGHFISPVFRGDDIFECQCGSQLFQIGKEGPYCVTCGTIAITS